jgi:hypothetical protein
VTGIQRPRAIGSSISHICTRISARSLNRKITTLNLPLILETEAMTVQPIRPRKFTRKLITALLAACILPVALPIFPAAAAPGYKPPRRQSAKRTENSGTRNQLASRIGDNLQDCSKDLTVPLTLVVPEEQKSADGKSSITPETTLAKPPLYVYLSAPKELKFSLSDGTKVLWTEPASIKESGITEIVYPASRPSLEVGKTYSWSVEIVCTSDSLQAQKNVGGRLTRVPLPPTVKQQLKAATTPRQRAEIYANAGFWSETLMNIAEAQQNSTDSAADQDLVSLLEQIDLKEIAQRERDSTTPAPQPADPKKPCH